MRYSDTAFQASLGRHQKHLIFFKLLDLLIPLCILFISVFSEFYRFQYFMCSTNVCMKLTGENALEGIGISLLATHSSLPQTNNISSPNVFVTALVTLTEPNQANLAHISGEFQCTLAGSCVPRHQEAGQISLKDLPTVYHLCIQVPQLPQAVPPAEVQVFKHASL